MIGQKDILFRFFLLLLEADEDDFGFCGLLLPFDLEGVLPLDVPLDDCREKNMMFITLIISGLQLPPQQMKQADNGGTFPSPSPPSKLVHFG